MILIVFSAFILRSIQPLKKTGTFFEFTVDDVLIDDVVIKNHAGRKGPERNGYDFLY